MNNLIQIILKILIGASFFTSFYYISLWFVAALCGGIGGAIADIYENKKGINQANKDLDLAKESSTYGIIFLILATVLMGIYNLVFVK